MVQLADYLFFNLSGAANCEYFQKLQDGSRVVELFQKLQKAFGTGRYHLVAHMKLQLVEDWGCAPFRLLDAALKALEADLGLLDQLAVDAVHQALKGRAISYANAAEQRSYDGVMVSEYAPTTLSQIIWTAQDGNEVLKTQLGTEQQLEEKVVVLRRNLAAAEQKLDEVRALNHQYLSLKKKSCGDVGDGQDAGAEEGQNELVVAVEVVLVVELMLSCFPDDVAFGVSPQ